MSRNRILLIALIVVVGWAGWRAWSASSASPDAGGAAAARSDSAKKGKDQVTSDKVPVVVSALSLSRGDDVFTRQRNLFDFAQSPEEIAAAEAAAKKAREDAEARAKAAAEKAQADAEAAKKAAELAREADRARQEELRLHPPPPPPPVPPSFNYQYVGTIGPVSAPFAILSGPDRAYKYVRAGEVIDRDFRLEFIGEKRLDISYTDPQFSNQFTQVQRQSDASARK